MTDPQLHKTQLSILHSLRYADGAERFNALMRPTGHTSDTFKFHLRKLVKLGFVVKRSDGGYELTAAGKEFANNLNEAERTTEKQPKISVLMVIPRQNSAGQTEYLVQQRSRNPFYGYWSEIHGRAEWGKSFEEIAACQLKRQTSLEASFTVAGFRRVRDYDKASNELLEDKLFAVLKATDVSGELTNSYSGGTNTWLTLDSLRSQDKVFATTLAIISGLESGDFYQAQNLSYAPEDY